MSTRRPLRLVFMCVLALSLLTGCVTSLAPTHPLLTTGDRSAAKVAVAVQANGIKHYVWIECSDASGCQLVYRRVRTGATLYQYVFTVAADTEIGNPDVAVTTDGRAFVVRSVCVDRVCTDYYSIFPANVSDTTVIVSEKLASTIANSAGPPKLAARDNIVYAAYLIETPGQARLRYRQLSGGTSGGYIDNRPDARVSDPSLTIGTNGALYVTWKATYVGSPEIAYSSNLGTTGNFIGLTSYDTFGNYSFHKPDIALDANNTPYIVYAYHGDAGDTVKIICQSTSPASCFGGVVYRTIPTSSLQMRGNPHIDMIEAAPAVVFSADTSATNNDEIWVYSPPASGADPGPTRVTTNNVHDSEPLIAIERSTNGAVPVVAWRTYITISPSPGVTYDCPDDVYVFYFTPSTARQISENAFGCTNESQDLAANGPWVAGVWTALDQEWSNRYVPWTAFNANTTYMPMTAR